MLQTEQKEYKSLLASRKLIVILLLLLTIIPYFSFISIIAFKPSIFGQLIDGYSLSGEVLNRDLQYERDHLEKYPDAAKYGGGSAWTTPAIDKDTNTLFFGTGNPSPQMSGDSRPGVTDMPYLGNFLLGPKY